MFKEKRKNYVSIVIDEAQFSDITNVRRHRPDYLIVLFMGILMLLGLVVIYAIGPQRANVLNNAYGSNYSSTYFFTKQIISVLLSVLVFAMMSVIPYTWFTRHSGKIFLFAVGACAFLLIAGMAHLGIAQETLGATRWFNLGPLGSIQPSEILKFAITIFLAGFLGYKANQHKINDVKGTLLPLAIIAAIALIFVVVIQEDLGTGASIIGIIAAMLFVGGLDKKKGLAIFVTILAIGVVFIISAPHRIERVLTFIQGDDTSETSDTSSYQVEHAKLAIGTGGLFGVGIGNSVQATGYLPEAINDSVFAIMGEIFGFVGSVIILFLFAGLLLRILKLTDHLVDYRLKLISAGVFGWLASHIILNIASMIGLMPLTGITLPLLSFGGTSMLFIAAALGLIFQLSRYSVHSSKIKEEEMRHEGLSSRRGIGRTRYASNSSFTRN